jgi:hypothetical protein
MLTLAVVVIDLLRRAVFQRSKGVNRGALVAGISSVLFVVAGVGCLVDTAFIHRTVVEKALISTICLALFFYVAKVVSNRARANGNWVDLSTKGLDDTRAFTLWSVLFFGSMWFSWQIEAPNSRNVLPYLPVLAIMFGAAIRSWGLRESLETGAQHEGIDFRQEVLGWLSSTRSAHRL